MTRPAGRAAVEIIGDTTKFASKLQADLNRALKGVDLNLKPVADQISKGLDQGIAQSGKAFDKLDTTAKNTFREVAANAQRSFSAIAADADRASTEVGSDFQTGGERAERALEELDRAATSEFSSIALKADAAAGKMSGKFAGAAGIIRSALLTVGVATGAGLAAITGFGLKAAGQLEQSRIAFQSLLGSVEAGNRVFADLQKFAALTPFEFPDVLPFAQKFLAFNEAVGLSDDQLQAFLTTVGDVVSVSGGGAEALDSVARAFSHIASGGKVSLEDINILSDALPGFNGIAAIAEAQGISTGEALKQISAGAISATEGTAALIAGMKKFPGAAGAMEKQSQTLLGVFSTFKDTIGQALAGAFEPVIPAIKDSLTQITPILGTALSELGPALGKVLAAVLPLLGQMVQILVPILTPLLDAVAVGVAALGPAMGPLGAALAQIAAAIAPLIGEIVELAVAFLPLVGAVVALVPLLIPLLVTGLDAVLSAVGPLIPLLTSFATFLGNNAGLVQGLAIALTALVVVTKLHAAAMAVQQAGSWAAALASYLKTVKLVQVATKVWAAVQWILNVALIANPIGIAVIAIAALVAGIILAWKHSEGFRKVVMAVWKAIKSAASAIGGAFVTAWDAVVDFFGGALRLIAELPGKVSSFLASLPGRLVALIKRAFDALLFAIGQGIGLAIAAFFIMPGKIIGALAALPGLLWTFIKFVWNGVTSTISTGIGQLVGFFTALPGRVVSALSAFGSVLGGLFTRAFNFAKTSLINGANAIINFIKSVPGRILALKDQMIAAGVGLIKGFLSGLQRVGGFLGNVAGSIVRGIKGFINVVVDKINSGIASIDDALPFSLPRIPRLARGGLTTGEGVAVLHPRELVLPLESRRAVDLLAQALQEADAGLRATGVITDGGAAPQFDVRVFIGTKELTDIVDVQVSERDRRVKAKVLAGAGRRT